MTSAAYDARREFDVHPESPTDAEIIARVEAGEHERFNELWQRHVDAATRYARSIAPQDAEDLVSEAFLLMFNRITRPETTPVEAFRPYLLTVIRNLVIKWGRERQRTELGSDVDRVDERHALTILHDEAVAEELTAAFLTLPERWQQVLWLTEVERLPRVRIAAQLDLAPNAVSALARRARAGLQLGWLEQQVPVGLGSDPEHVAALLPRYVAKPRGIGGELRTRVAQHLSECAECASLHHELRSLHQRTRRRALGVVALVSAGGALPSGGGIAAGGSSALIGWVGAGASGTGILATATASLGAAAAGTVIIATIGLGIAGVAGSGSEQQSSADRPAPTTVQPQTTDDSGDPGSDAEEGGTSTEPAGGGEQNPTHTTTGRGNTDPQIPIVQYRSEPEIPRQSPARPALAAPLPDATEDPAESTDPAESEDPDATEDPNITTPVPVISGPLQAEPPTTGYEAPILQGTALPGEQLRGTVDGTAYAVTADGSGQWALDLRMLDLPAGQHTYAVTSDDRPDAAPLASGSFVLLGIDVTGFAGNPTLPIDEARSTGIVAQLTGPGSGTVCVSLAMNQQYAQIALDEAGEATVRFRFLENGFYMLEFQLCSEVAPSPVTEAFVAAEDPDVFVSPFQPDPTVDAVVIERID